LGTDLDIVGEVVETEIFKRFKRFHKRSVTVIRLQALMDAVVVFGIGALKMVLAVGISETEIRWVVRHRILTLYIHFYIVQNQTFV